MSTNMERARRALLYGAVAHRLGLLDRERLAEQLKTWVAFEEVGDSASALASRSLDAVSARRLEASVRQLLAVHGGDSARALAAVPFDAASLEILENLPLPELRLALAEAEREADGPHDAHATLGFDVPAVSPIPASEFDRTIAATEDAASLESISGRQPHTLVEPRGPEPEPALEGTIADPYATRVSLVDVEPTLAAGEASHSDFAGPRTLADLASIAPDQTHATAAMGSGLTHSFLPEAGSGPITHATAQATGIPSHATAQATGIPSHATAQATVAFSGDPHATAQVSDAVSQASHEMTAFFAAPPDSKQPRTDGSPAAAPQSPAATALAAPRSLILPTAPRPRYQVRRSHAKGGLGEVYVAVDTELNREVALKEIQNRHADDALSRARFVVEAEVTGGLEHPGIVPVYGMGQYLDGRPYYAMRFVRGQTFKEAVDAFHAKPKEGETPPALPAPPASRELELHKLLRRFIDVCNAIDYAHSRGVLHRDIKPANVMLGPFGETLVVDWGLAKPLQPADDTNGAGNGKGRPLGRERGSEKFEIAPGTGPLRPPSASGSMYQMLFGSTVGTPHFMSPEQAEGNESGPASDIYSLGATLYYLLVGRVPFTEKKLRALLDLVKEGRFDPPRVANPQVHPALDAICLKAMALRPEDRHASARALANDLEQWMADEPVEAYPEPWTARAARWARRHRTAVTTAASLLITAVVGLSVATALIDNERRKTEANYQLARQAVDTLLTQLGETELADIPGAEDARRKMLEEARGFYDRFLAMQGTRPSVRQGAGQAYLRAGKVLELLGRYPEAEARYAKSQVLLRNVAQTPGPEGDVYRRDLATAHHELGALLTKLGRYKESAAELATAVQMRKELASATSATEADRAAEKDSVYRLGALLARRGKTGAAEESYTWAIRQAAAEVDAAAWAQPATGSAPPVDPDATRRLAQYRNNLGMLYRWSRPDEAEKLFQSAREGQIALVSHAPANAVNRWRLARATNNLGALDDDRDRVAEAAKLYHEAETYYDQLASGYPKVPDYRFELATLRINIAWLFQRGIRPLDDPLPTVRAQAAHARDRLQRALTDLQELIQRYPRRPDYRLRVLDTRVRLASLDHLDARIDARESLEISDASRRVALRRKAEAAEGNVERALQAVVDELHVLVGSGSEGFPDYAESIDYRLALATARTSQAIFVLREGADPATQSAAAPAIEEALRLCAEVLADDPANHQAAGLVFDAQLARATLLERSTPPAHAGALAALDEAVKVLESDPVPSPFTLRNASHEMAKILGQARDPQLLSQFGPRAVDVVRKAIEAGFPATPAEFDHPDFAALRDLEPFQKLQEAARTPPATRG